MRRSIWERIQEIINKHVIHGKWVRSVIALSCVVIFITTYVLVMPAVTLSGTPDCGQEEHRHTDDCYETQSEQICGLEEHTHSDDCYDEDGNLICGLEEHVHNDGCYETEEVLTCGMEEHIHTADCYKGTDAEGADQEDGSSSSEDAGETESKTEQGEDVTDEVNSGDAESVDAPEAAEAADPEGPAESEEPVSGNLLAEGEDYTITVSYTEEANLPADVSLKVEEITNKEEYDSYKSQVEEEILDPESKKVTAARFFDITLLDSEGNELHPEKAVTVVIETKDTLNENEELQVCHFDQEQEKPVKVKSQEIINETYKEDNLGVQFEAESFSVYGIVGTESITVPFTTGDGRTYEVTVDFDKDAGIPEGAQLKVSEVTEDNSKYDDYVEQATDAIDSRAEALNYIKLLNIEIVDENGDKVDLEAPVDVTIKLLDKEQNEEEQTQVVHFEGANEMPVVLDSSAEADTVSFSADGFSVYAIVYTVDFRYEVNGKVYEFSLPGGGFVSFSKLAEVLGINTEYTKESSTASLTLSDVAVSDATRKFVADVESLKFSTPGLVDVSRVENQTTVGKIKENRGLDVRYSSELKEEQIEEINAQTVEAGDWALISMHPFTSEETLAVTMKDGEQFTIKVTDGQLHTYVISDSGDTYEIIVTYDDSAEIPADAELRVRQIQSTEDVFTKNVEATNKELLARDASEVMNPVQFDIAIISNGKEIEPKEGSVVNVECKLASEVFAVKEDSEEDGAENIDSETEESEIWINGIRINGNSEDDASHYTVSHIAEDGTVEMIEDVSCSVNEDEKIVFQFETESFSDYLFDESNTNTLRNLPDTIYVGDEIYMYNRADYWVTNIGSVVSETKHPNGQNDGSKWKTVTAQSTGTFRIYNRYNQYNDYKEIRVLPARTGTATPGTIDTVDNASIGLTLNLFDYDLDNYLDDYFNNYDHGDNPVSQNFLNRSGSINSGHDLKFWGSGIDDRHGSYNQYNRYLVTNIVKNTTDTGAAGGYPVLKHNSTSLNYLFTPSDGTDKKAYTNVNHLFKKEGDYYIYDSNSNYAYYDKSQGNGGNFTVYERTYEQKSRDDGGEQAGHTNGKAIGFFPFHKWDEDYDLFVNWNKNLNHHFGMSMSVPFSLPKAPKAVEDTNQKPIIFEFSGDDDLWVFIDGKLAMDIGGIHQPTSGTINFTDKKVIVNGNEQRGFDFSGLYDGKKHTLQVFYIERGGCDSNCMIKFNMTQYGDVEFDKVDEDDNSVLLPGAVFGLYKDAACTEPLMEKLDAAHGNTLRSFTVETDEHGHAKLEDVPLGDYYLKEIHAPDGYPLTVGAEAARVRVYLDASGNVKVSVNGTESGAKITNKKPSPIDLGLKKEWQDANEQTIPAPAEVIAVFEIKRIRTYEIHTERKIEGEGEESSHLTVGWIHDNQPYKYKEFDLVAGSQVTVSWSYKDGYEGTIGCRLNGTDINKSPNPNNVYSQGFSMPAAGQNATFYIIDDSENGEAISGINVAGSQFYGNSGGGYVHTFHQITEPDPEFTYTGENVTDNKVTLPINENTWQYLFANLPVFGSGTVRTAIEPGGPEQDYDVTFHYSYYLEEVSNTAPEGTTVIYKDLSGNVISSLTDAETSVSGTETVINRIPFGYLKIEKKVTYNGSDQNLTSEQKSKLAGEYKFKIYTKEQCADADAVQDPDAPDEAEDKDLIVTINIGTDGQAVSSSSIRLLAGNYWIKEVESSNPMMFPVQNPIAVTVTKDHTTSSPVIKTLTNNYDENNGPDKISIDIEKIFQGLDSPNQVPSDFQVLLQYKVNGETKTVTLQNRTATGENGETITWSESSDGFTWHWKVGNIDNTATDFKIKEINQDNTTGYDWKSAFLNGTGTENNITSTVTEYHDLTVTAPMVEFGDDVKTQRITSDSDYNRAFFLLDDDVLLTALTANQGSLVISKKPLNLLQRKAVEAHWPGQGSIKKPGIYFSIEEHPKGFTYDNKQIVFGEKDGKAVVKFTSNASSNEAIFVASYTSQEAYNIANLLNNYEEVPITIDIIKVDKKNTSKKLPGAVFTLRQLADEPPTDNGTLTTMDGTTPLDSVPTDGNGKTSFNNLTHGNYEISEKTAPDGYVLSSETTQYFRIESGVVKWLVRGTDKPSEWVEKTGAEENGMVGFEPAHPEAGEQSATNAAFTVKNEPGAVLPSTGGPGTSLICLLGIMLTGLAGAGMVMQLRRKAS